MLTIYNFYNLFYDNIIIYNMIQIKGQTIHHIYNVSQYFLSIQFSYYMYD